MKKNSKHFVIGIDGGGTKTEGIISGFDGEPIAILHSGASNYLTIGIEKSAITILKLILDLVKKANIKLNDVGIIVIGLAGAGRKSDQKIIFENLNFLAKKNKIVLPKVKITSDALIALDGAFNLKNGAILIAGTGSILFAKNKKDKIFRVGGWGRILGDGGSGYFIGREAIHAILKSYDKSGEKTALSNLAKKIMKWDSTDKIINDVYKNNFIISSFAPVVIESAKKNDKVSKEILFFGAKQLTSLIKPVSKEIEKISLIGSLFSGNSYYKKIVVKNIKSNFKNIEIVEPEHSPAYGAVLNGLKSLNV